MGSIAVLFPGQGSQSVGMMRDFAELYPLVKTRFHQASDIVGIDLWDIAQNDTNARLNQTAYTQPILLTASFACYEILKQETNLNAAFMAGHSLGEYTALLAAGALSFEEAVRLVNKRGALMQNAIPRDEAAMAAIIGLNDKQVAQICMEVAGDVYPANYNTSEQIVISGRTNAVELAVARAKEMGAKRAVLLPVSVPSHCPLMRAAAAELSFYLNQIQWKLPEKTQVIYNVDGQTRQTVDGIISALGAQLYQPVLWTSCIKKLVDSGVDTFIEMAPAKVLTGLNKRIVPSLKTLSFDHPAALDTLKDHMR